MAAPEVSLQLIVFGERTVKNPSQTFSEVRTSGFAAVEAGNLFKMFGEEKARSLLEENSLRVSGAHFGYGDYSSAENLAANIGYASALGIKHMMCSGIANGSIEGYKESAAVFTRVGKILSDSGIRFSYHNHDWEFKDLGGGVTGMDILLAETDPATVYFNMDVFWLYYAGLNPAAFIRSHLGRAVYYHFKDGRIAHNSEGKPYPEFIELGQGEVDLAASMNAALEAEAEWIVCEQDRTSLDPAESARISRTYLKDKFFL